MLRGKARPIGRAFFLGVARRARRIECFRQSGAFHGKSRGRSRIKAFMGACPEITGKPPAPLQTTRGTGFPYGIIVPYVENAGNIGILLDPAKAAA